MQQSAMIESIENTRLAIFMIVTTMGISMYEHVLSFLVIDIWLLVKSS
jgi:hypothetical protein